MSLQKLPTNRQTMLKTFARLTPQLSKSLEQEMQATGLGKSEIIRAALSDRYRNEKQKEIPTND